MINAAGPQAPLVGKMVGLDLPVDPRKRHIFVTDSFTEIRHPMPLVTDITSGFYCRSEQGAILMSPGDIGAHTEYTASVDWSVLEQTVEKAVRRMPALEHAQIRHAHGTYTLTDLGSTNGTRLNGQTIQTRELTDGDRITIGSTVLEFRWGQG